MPAGLTFNRLRTATTARFTYPWPDGVASCTVYVRRRDRDEGTKTYAMAGRDVEVPVIQGGVYDLWTVTTGPTAERSMAIRYEHPGADPAGAFQVDTRTDYADWTTGQGKPDAVRQRFIISRTGHWMQIRIRASRRPIRIRDIVQEVRAGGAAAGAAGAAP
jgi:hypothetical protein